MYYIILYFRYLFPDEERLSIVKWIKFKGIKFVSNQCYVVIGYEERLPVFAEVHKIVWKEENPLLVCKIVQTINHNMELMAYEIRRTENFALHSLTSLAFHKVLHHHRLAGKIFVIVKHLWGDLH